MSLLKNVEGLDDITAATTHSQSASEAVSEENGDNNNKEPIDPIQEAYEAIKGLDGAPDIMQLYEWKDIHKEFYVSSVHGEDLYIWRTLKRSEHKSIAESGAMKDEYTFENAVVRRCLLWPKPSPEFFVESGAGVIPTLFRQIMYQSGFIPDDMALTLIRPI